MKKCRLLLLDANVVIELFGRGLWERVIDLCDVHLSRTVAEVEAHFYVDEKGERHDFDLQQDASAGRISVFDVTPSQVDTLRSEFDLEYAEGLDPGEAESLVRLLSSSEPWLVCSADKIVYRVLGNLGRSDQGMSLEEVLHRIGLGRSVGYAFAKAYRECWTRKGEVERVQGRGRKPH